MGSCLAEGFRGAVATSMDQNNEMARSAMVINFVVMVVFFFLILFFGKWLWNEVACSLFTVTKKADSIWQLVGLAILLSLISP